MIISYSCCFERKVLEFSRILSVTKSEKSPPGLPGATRYLSCGLRSWCLSGRRLEGQGGPELCAKVWGGGRWGLRN